MDLAASESSKEHVAHTHKPCVHLAPDALQTMHAPTRGGLDVAIGGRGSLLLDAGTLAATLTGSGATAEPDLLGGAAGSGTPPLDAGPLCLPAAAIFGTKSGARSMKVHVRALHSGHG